MVHLNELNLKYKNNHGKCNSITRKMNLFEKEELKDAIGKSPDVAAVRTI